MGQQQLVRAFLGCRHAPRATVEVLLQHGASLRSRNKRSLTPLGEALLAGRVDTAGAMIGTVSAAAFGGVTPGVSELLPCQDPALVRRVYDSGAMVASMNAAHDGMPCALNSLRFELPSGKSCFGRWANDAMAMLHASMSDGWLCPPSPL